MLFRGMLKNGMTSAQITKDLTHLGTFRKGQEKERVYEGTAGCTDTHNYDRVSISMHRTNLQVFPALVSKVLYDSIRKMLDP